MGLSGGYTGIGERALQYTVSVNYPLFRAYFEVNTVVKLDVCINSKLLQSIRVDQTYGTCAKGLPNC